ncbi:MAG TPA: glycosyltransferase [Caulobacteraceae bacterium]|nr:glycosyltransferase [Caulobacteraceae bacterium]
MRRPRIQVSAQYLTAGAGGIARCARLSLLALADQAGLAALAVEDEAPTQVGPVISRAFAGDRSRFVGANGLGALTRDWVFYDFAGTARAHAPLSLLRRPYAVWAHGWEVWPGNLRPDYANALLGARAVFVNSRHTAARLAQSLPGVTRVHCCLLGTEQDDSDAAKTGEREPRVLFVGRSDEMFAKGQDVLIAAWPAVVAEVPEARLTFAGGGERLDRLRALAAASPAAASIEVLGSLGDGEVASLQRRARLFAMLSNVEGFGLVFAEAMRQGAPVLSGNADASTEVNLDGVTGFAVDREDLATIAERIIAVLKYDRLFEQLSRKAHERWASQFRFSAFRDRFLDAASTAGMVRTKGGRRGEPVRAT